MATIVALSGSSNSGKTTLIHRIEAAIPGCLVLAENIREHLAGTSIDEVRSNPLQYFELQKKVITQKINREIEARQHRGLVLVDRSLADSLWYLVHYTNTAGFRSDQLRDYADFVQYVIDSAKMEGPREYPHRYDHIFFAKTIFPIEENQFRPQALVSTVHMEAAAIRVLTSGLFQHTTITDVDVRVDTDRVLDSCREAAAEEFYGQAK